MKKKYLYFPFLIFLSAFVTDKLFFIGDFPDYFLRTLSFINYDHKILLARDLRNYLRQKDRKKTLVLFGNSRTLSFDNDYISNTYPDWILYNFSVPGGTSDYFYYYMEQFQKLQIKPDSIVFVLSPQGFNLSPGIAMDEVMLNGLPASFVARHAGKFRLDDITNYAAKKVFWTDRCRPNLDTIRYRLRNDSEFMYDLQQFKARVHVSLLENRGSTPYTDHADGEDPDFWEETARQTYRNFLTPFLLHPGMLEFTSESLRFCQEASIPSYILWARVAPELRRLKAEERSASNHNKTIKELWLPSMLELSQKYNSPLLDMNYAVEMNCDDYYDASHLAGRCFGEFSDHLFRFVQK